ncbi:MAG TPA: hypothetical protein VFX60_04005 [Micromonospora sp.]|nr:hypothetical protein [Micromonospora sp.]
MPDLDLRLAQERAELRDAIEQPPLTWLRQQAAARVRHRRAAFGTTLLAVALTAALTVRPWAADPAPPPIAATPPATAVYTGAGITINGLTSPALDIPGTIVDVEFVTPDTGYLLAECARVDPCHAFVARTNDGGITWTGSEVPFTTDGDELDLIAFPDQQLVLAGSGYRSRNGGRSWERATAADTSTPLPIAPDDRLQLGPHPQPGRCGGPIEIWHPGFLRGGTMLSQPHIEVCWVAPTATADGAWWAGGMRDGHAALAVTRDRGQTWRTTTLDTPAHRISSVEVTFLGSHAYAVVLGPDRTITALYHSADGGQTFTRTRKENAGAPRSLAGAMVPLLDGRLLVAGGDRRWYVSADDGATFTRVEGNLPVVGRLARTSAGYIAYDLFRGGWAAFSSDGSTWRKLQIN